MPKFRFATILLVITLIPIAIGFAWGAEMNAQVALIWLFPTAFSGEQVNKWGWPVNAHEFLKPYLDGQLLEPVTIAAKVGLILVVATCAALGTIRIHIAKITAWFLLAALPFAVAFWNLRLDGQIYLLPPDYVVAAICSLLSLAAWWFSQWATRRWLYKGVSDREPATKRQKLVFVILAIFIVLTSLSGWSWLQRMQDYMKDKNLSQVTTAALSHVDRGQFASI